jgi:2-polyprenyl-6-methoxyphenol hydroxylase-like FAD-dependent oxidoreductase
VSIAFAPDVPSGRRRAAGDLEYVFSFGAYAFTAVCESSPAAAPQRASNLFADTWLLKFRYQMTYMVSGQNITEGILRDHLHKHGVDVEMGTELRTLKQDVNGECVDVVLVKMRGEEKVEERVSVEWLIGADGARGVVRKQLDVTFLGETRDESTMLVGDFRIKGLDGDVRFGLASTCRHDTAEFCLFHSTGICGARWGPICERISSF